jgi:transaldolase
VVIRIFADGAEIATMGGLVGRVEGFTTNPSLLKKAGISDYRSFSKAVLQAVGLKPVSFEVLSDDLDKMESEAFEIASWGPNVYVKVPITNSEGVSTTALLRKLTADGVRVNVTAVMTLAQAELAMQHIMQEGSIVSIFAGRIADTGVDPEPIVRGAVLKARGRTQVLWASAREVFNVVQAERCGADIITLSPELIGKLSLFGRGLETYSLETVQQFKRDSEGITL